MREVNKIYDICQKSVRVCVAIYPIITMSFTDRFTEKIYFSKNTETHRDLNND